MNFNKVRYSVNVNLRLTQNLYLLWDVIALVFQALSSVQQCRLCVRFELYFFCFNFKTFDVDFPQYTITEEPQFMRPLIVNRAFTMYNSLEFRHSYLVSQLTELEIVVAYSVQ